MGKQTQKNDNIFGGEWTIQKLKIIEKYLQSFVKVFKNTKILKKIYVDGFAGCGSTKIKNTDNINMVGDNSLNLEGLEEISSITDVKGSALISLEYDFDEYYFLEINEDRANILKQSINNLFPLKIGKVNIIIGDFNKNVEDIMRKISKYDRCVMFLDPYALELNWKTLDTISKCPCVDLWYLFPLSSIRLLNNNGDIDDANKIALNNLLGTDEWQQALYRQSKQLSLFDDEEKERVGFDEVISYINNRFKSIFSYVASNQKILKNKKRNSPMFMLSFMMTNKSEKAHMLAQKIVNGIIKSVDDI